MHIAILTVPGNGHVYPVLPLCTELIKRGHRVTSATTSQYAHTIRSVGAEPRVIGKTSPPEDPAHGPGTHAGSSGEGDSSRWEISPQARFHFIESARRLLPELEQLYEGDVPDVILYDRFLVAGRILAKRLDVPAVQISAHFASCRNSLLRKDGMFCNPEPVVELGRALDDFLSEHGIHAPGSLWHTEALNIYFLPQAFQYNAEELDEQRSCFVGASINRPFSPSWTNRSGGKPIVLVSGFSGTAGSPMDGGSGFFKVFIDALRDSPYHCILSIGSNIPESALGPLPSNFEVNRHASHLEILPHVALSVCHGGMGSTLEALYHGVPVLAIPMNPRTEEVAFRLRELGLGTSVSRRALTPDQALACVNEMTHDAELCDRVKHTQQVFRRSGGARLGAEKIEAYCRNG